MNFTKLDRNHIQTILVILGLVILIPFLPNRTIDPWQLFNPFRFGWLIIILAGIQFGGYFAIRAMGNRLGMVFTGFFGGLVSSTAVLATLPHIVKNRPELARPAITAAIFSNIGMLVELALIIFAISPYLAKIILMPILAMIITGGFTTLALMNHDQPPFIAEPPNPFSLIRILRLALIIAAMMFIVAFAQKQVGHSALILVTFLGGLFEIHSVSLATTNLFAQGNIPQSEAILLIGTAILSSHLSKFALLLILARNQFGLYTAMYLIIMLLVGFLGFWLIY